MFWEWISKIVGLGALGVLLGVILPEGETNKYIKGVFGIVTVFVLFSPIPKLVGVEVNLGQIIEVDESIDLDSGYTYYVYSKKWEEIERSLEKVLEEKFGIECCVDVKFVETCPQKIDVVFVYLKNAVIEGDEANKYRVEVEETLTKNFDIDKNQVVVRYE